MIFNLASAVYWQVITAVKQRQVNIHYVQEDDRQVTHEYSIGNQVFMEMTGIYRTPHYSKQGPYIITKFFANCTVQYQHRQANKRINIKWLKLHFEK